MHIRKAQLEDLDSITELERICFPPLEAASRHSFKERLDAFSDCFLLAEENGAIIGFINGCVTNSKVICDEMFEDTSYHQPDGDYQSIFGLDVHPDYRKKGVASRLMAELIELSRERKKKGLILTCKEHLLNFYGSFGYENLGISASNHGGATWYDMILLLQPES